MTPHISVIIPTRNRNGLLSLVLEAFKRQTLVRELYEIVVVNDGGDFWPGLDCDRVIYQEHAGPATARNKGVESSSGNIVLFLGDDTIPQRNCLYYHWLTHYAIGAPVAVQGYTDWWPDLPPLALENFLTGDSGLQANWRALKHDDGSWKKEANGFCLTTNYSIDKSEFLRVGGFNPSFPNAAWEDVCFGLEAQMLGVKTLFQPDSITYHAHRQNLDGFIKRQMMEGESRLVLCALHPELTWNLLSPESLRKTSTETMRQAIELARELSYIQSQDLQDMRQQRWYNAFREASWEGVRRGIEIASKRCKAWLAIPHLHTEEEAHHIATCASFIERNLAYAETSIEWAIRQNSNNWAIWAVKGELELALGHRENAIAGFRRSVELGPGEKWPLDRLSDLEQSHRE